MVGIIYATGSKMIRRIVIPDDPKALDDGTHGPYEGESMLKADSTKVAQQGAEALIQDETGETPTDPRCAVIANGLVVAVIHADPSLDADPRGTLVNCAKEINIGDGCVDGVFTKAIPAAGAPKVIP